MVTFRRSYDVQGFDVINSKVIIIFEKFKQSHFYDLNLPNSSLHHALEHTKSNVCIALSSAVTLFAIK